jgi:hypothetical protein
MHFSWLSLYTAQQGYEHFMMTAMTLFGNKALRLAIQQNKVTFPAQIPSFARPEVSELQIRIAQLYFIAGWTVERIGHRYEMSDAMVRKTLTGWRVRAIASGYIQEIDPEPAPPLKELDIEDQDEPLQVSPSEPPQTGRQAWPPIYIRLLELVRRECDRIGFFLSAAQVERIQSTLLSEPKQIAALLQDLRNRMTDEQRRSNTASVELIESLIAELELATQDSNDPAYVEPQMPLTLSIPESMPLKITAGYHQ